MNELSYQEATLEQVSSEVSARTLIVFLFHMCQREKLRRGPYASAGERARASR